MSDRYRLQETADRILATVPCEVTLTDDHRAILSAASKLVHMKALVENQADQLTELRTTVASQAETIERLQKVVDAAIHWKVEAVADDDDMELIGAEDNLIAAVHEYLQFRQPEPEKEGECE